jgi:hypothetical protein
VQRIGEGHAIPARISPQDGSLESFYMAPKVGVRVVFKQVVRQRCRAGAAVRAVQPAEQRIVGHHGLASLTGFV